jgi:DNA-binding transcriptional MerR regulator
MAIDSSDSFRHVRIGEFSRRVGVEADLLRSWERRYSLLSPSRTPGGLRLYGDADERRVGRMLEHLKAGISAAEAARLTLREFDATPPQDTVSPLEPTVLPVTSAAGPEQLWTALDQLDDATANLVLDRLLSAFSLEAVIRQAVLPYLHALGERWRECGDTASGDSAIAQEHFASALLRGRLLGLARGWGAGYGPMALLACFPTDQHDLGLICFGLALRENGWRITFLGPDTPFATVESTAREMAPDLIVLASSTRTTPVDSEEALRRIAALGPLALAGGGIDESLPATVGAMLLTSDPFAAAARIAHPSDGRAETA